MRLSKFSGLGAKLLGAKLLGAISGLGAKLLGLGAISGLGEKLLEKFEMLVKFMAEFFVILLAVPDYTRKVFKNTLVLSTHIRLAR